MRERTRLKASPSEQSLLGDAVPPPERSAAPLWERSVVQTDGAAAPQVGSVDRQLAAQPSQRGAALCAGGPEGGMASRWRSEATKGK